VVFHFDFLITLSFCSKLAVLRSHICKVPTTKISWTYAPENEEMAFVGRYDGELVFIYGSIIKVWPLSIRWCVDFTMGWIYL